MSTKTPIEILGQLIALIDKQYDETVVYPLIEVPYLEYTNIKSWYNRYMAVEQTP